MRVRSREAFVSSRCHSRNGLNFVLVVLVLYLKFLIESSIVVSSTSKSTCSFHFGTENLGNGVQPSQVRIVKNDG